MTHTHTQIQHAHRCSRWGLRKCNYYCSVMWCSDGCGACSRQRHLQMEEQTLESQELSSTCYVSSAVRTWSLKGVSLCLRCTCVCNLLQAEFQIRKRWKIWRYYISLEFPDSLVRNQSFTFFRAKNISCLSERDASGGLLCFTVNENNLLHCVLTALAAGDYQW